MSSLVLLIPLSLLIMAIAVGVFFWAVRNGQYDDLDSPAWRVVLDDDRSPSSGRRASGTGPDSPEDTDA